MFMEPFYKRMYENLQVYELSAVNMLIKNLLF